MNGGIHDAFELVESLGAVLASAPIDRLDQYTRRRRAIAEAEILAQADRNRARMQERDPVKRREMLDALKRLTADLPAAREHLLRTSMISGLRRRGGHRMTTGYDYGRAGLAGIGTPQANPTVEAEMRILLPPDIAMTVARLTSAARDPQDRLRAYLERLDDTLSQFDSLRPAIFAFACTGSSYLVAPAREAAIVRRLEDRLGYPVVTAAAAIRWRLRAIGAERIALVAPYPDWLADAADAYWRMTGFEVAGYPADRYGRRRHPRDLPARQRGCAGGGQRVVRVAGRRGADQRDGYALAAAYRDGIRWAAGDIVQSLPGAAAVRRTRPQLTRLARASLRRHWRFIRRPASMTQPPSAIIDSLSVGGTDAPIIVVNPATEEPIAEIAEAGAALVSRAVTSARDAFDRGDWRTMAVEARQRVLRACADAIEAAADDIADIECANTGIPYTQVRGRQIARSANNFRFFADFIGQSAAELYEQNPDYLTFVRREPIGVAALMSPWKLADFAGLDEGRVGNRLRQFVAS